MKTLICLPTSEKLHHLQQHNTVRVCVCKDIHASLRVCVCAPVCKEQSNQLGCRGNKEGESIGHAMEPRCCHLSWRFSDSNHSSSSMRQQIGKWLFVSNTSALIHWGILFPLTSQVKYPLFQLLCTCVYSRACVCVCVCVCFYIWVVSSKTAYIVGIFRAAFLCTCICQNVTYKTIHLLNLTICNYICCVHNSIFNSRINRLNCSIATSLSLSLQQWMSRESSKYAFH